MSKLTTDELVAYCNTAIEKAKEEFRKPTHGTCCTCQVCGGSLDDDPCLCGHIKTFQSLIAKLRAADRLVAAAKGSCSIGYAGPSLEKAIKDYGEAQ